MSKKDNPPPQTAKKGIIRTSVKVATHITGSPVEAVGWRRIISNFNVIRLLWTILKLSARPNPEETVNGKGQEILDSPAQADVVGRQLPSIRQAVSYSHLSDQDLALVIMRRQKETFIRAYSAGLIATVLFGMWALEMIFFRGQGAGFSPPLRSYLSSPFSDRSLCGIAHSTGSYGQARSQLSDNSWIEQRVFFPDCP